MDDRELEDMMRRSVPETTPADLDRRVRGAARALLGGEESPGTPFRSWWAPAAVAAAVLAVVFLVDGWGDDASPSPLRLAAAGGGRFVLANRTRADLDDSASRLMVKSGPVTAVAVAAPLVVAFPHGSVVLARGEVEVTVSRVEAEDMGRVAKRWGAGTALVVGVWLVVVEVRAGGAEVAADAVSLELAAGESAALVVPTNGAAVLLGRRRAGEEGATGAGSGGSEAASDAESLPTRETADPGAALATPPALVGVVRGPKGDPIPGAEVSWMSVDGRGFVRCVSTGSMYSMLSTPHDRLSLPAAVAPLVTALARTETDAAGRFELGAPPAGTMGVMVRAEGFAAWILKRPVPTSPSVEEQVVVLSLRRTLRGSLRGPDGAVVRGGGHFARVDVLLPLDEDPDYVMAFRVPVDRTGNFTAALGIETVLGLEVEVEGFVAVSRSVNLPAGLDASVNVDLALTDHVSGVVVDAAGRPVSGATVTVESKKEVFFVTRDERTVGVTTAAEGYFRGTVVGSKIVLTAEAPGHGIARLVPRRDERHDLRIVLPERVTGALSGRIAETAGMALEGFPVTLRRRGALNALIQRTTTGADGTYRFEGLVPGRWRVTLERATSNGLGVRPGIADDPFFIDLHSAEVEVRANEETTGVDIDVAATGSIVGMVLDGEGKPAPTSVLHLVRPDFIGGKHEELAMRSTDPEGRFRFDGVPVGRFAIAANFGRTVKVVEVKANEVLEITVGGVAARVAGRLLRDGTAVSGARVVVGRIADGSIDANEAQTGSDGGFEVGGLEEGAHFVRFEDRDTGHAIYVNLWATASGASQVVNWPAGRVRGTVRAESIPPDTRVDLHLEALEGVELAAIIPADYRKMATAAVRSDGTFHFDRLSPGTYRATTTVAGVRRERRFEVGLDELTIELR